MAYSNVRFDRFADPAGAVVAAEKGDSLKSRWGISLDHQNEWENGRSHIYGLVNLSYEWLDGTRSEEHTSELQSLMRISYAVFCLIKTTTKEINTVQNALS